MSTGIIVLINLMIKHKGAGESSFFDILWLYVKVKEVFAKVECNSW